jgi:catalase
VPLFLFVLDSAKFGAVSVWAAVDQDLSDRIAKAVGAPTVKPLQVKPASEAVRFRANLGVYTSSKV